MKHHVDSVRVDSNQAINNRSNGLVSRQAAFCQAISETLLPVSDWKPPCVSSICNYLQTFEVTLDSRTHKA